MWSCCCQGVLRVEGQLGGRLIDKSTTVQFVFNGGDLRLSIEQVAAGWWLKQLNGFQVRTPASLESYFSVEQSGRVNGTRSWRQLEAPVRFVGRGQLIYPGARHLKIIHSW